MIAQGISIGEYMDRIDRLLNKAKPKPTICEILAKDNPYLGKTEADLLNYLSRDNYRAPDMHTTAWSKFMYALMYARSAGALQE